MSKSQTEIVCRSCREEFPVSSENCPYCGTSIRNDRTLIAGVIIGVLVVGASILDLSGLLFFAVVGVAIAGASGYLLYDKRQRIAEASEAEEELFGTAEEAD